MTATLSRPTPRPAADPPDWWRGAVTYQVYIRSFADSDGDGLGDIEGIRSRLPYLAELGVDALWINPWFPSPQADGGYDVSDYRSIDPAFGTLDDAQRLIDDAHAAGLRVLLDIVPNHTSDEHQWFRAALEAGPGSPERARYLFRPGRGADGAQPPNDWQSVFGGPAWDRVPAAGGTPGEWYLHLFDARQPDLDWSNPQVRGEFLDVLAFWFDRGADGFRIDVAHGLVKDPALPDLGHGGEELLGRAEREDHPYWDRAGVHEIYRDWRELAESYDPPKVFVAEAWVASPERLSAYLRPDELHTAFDFDFLRSHWRAPALRAAVTGSLAAHARVGAPVTWVLSNHDIVRHVTRLGRRSRPAPAPEGTWNEATAALHATGGQVDPALGRRRARAAILFELALPGAVYLYQGEELGLEEVEDLPESVLADPVRERSGHTERGRDGCRVPVPWTADGPSLGFGPAGAWLPQPAGWGALCVQAQQGDPSSMLELYRSALRLRHLVPALGAADGTDDLEWVHAGEGAVAFRRGPGFLCVLNPGDGGFPLPAGDVLLASAPVVDGVLPADAAAWVAPA